MGHFSRHSLSRVLERNNLPPMQLSEPPTRQDRTNVAMAIRMTDYRLAAELCLDCLVDSSESELSGLLFSRRGEIQSDEETVARRVLEEIASNSR